MAKLLIFSTMLLIGLAFAVVSYRCYQVSPDIDSQYAFEYCTALGIAIAGLCFWQLYKMADSNR